MTIEDVIKIYVILCESVDWIKMAQEVTELTGGFQEIWTWKK